MISRGTQGDRYVVPNMHKLGEPREGFLEGCVQVFLGLLPVCPINNTRTITRGCGLALLNLASPTEHTVYRSQVQMTIEVQTHDCCMDSESASTHDRGRTARARFLQAQAVVAPVFLARWVQ
jgi:hypothetical protein